MSLSASLIILTIIVIRIFLINELPKKTFMALWGVAVCRLLLPLSVPSRLNIWNIGETLSEKLQTVTAMAATVPVEKTMASELTQVTVVETLITNTPISSAGVGMGADPALPWFFWLWLAGFCACALFFLVSHIRWQYAYKTALPVENSFIEQWLSAHPLIRKVRIRQSDKIDAPLTYGIIRPVILFPSSTNWHDETSLSYFMMHEYTHIRRFDTLFKWLLVAALSIHWFNPLVWLMYAFANRDMELSCDEKVVRTYGNKAKSDYAMTLISLGEKQRRQMSLCSNFSKGAIEERVLAIMVAAEVTIVRILIALVLVSGVVILFATTKAVAEGPPRPVDPASKPPRFTETVVADLPQARMESVGKTIVALLGNATLKMTEDGKTWSDYEPILNEEDWHWFNEKEFIEFMEIAIAEYRFSNYTSGNIYPAALKADDKAPGKLMQTLADIRNGIKVSRYKHIYIAEVMEPGAELPNEWLLWYCFGYTFKDKAGNEVDLGLFETRDDLFAALKKYYMQEVEKGNMTQIEADTLYKQIAHPIRYNDEMRLKDKLQIARSYSAIAGKTIE